MARLDSICTINMGQSPDSSTYNEDAKGLPFFQGNADFGEIHPNVRLWCSEPTKVAKKNDILISVRAPIGALNISNCECCIGRGLAALSVNPDICIQKYLWYALASRVDELNSKGTGSTFKAINKKTLVETEIPLPGLEKQREIAAQLDKVSDLIAKRLAQLDKLDLLVKARFVEMFGDPVTNQYNLPTVEFGSVLTVKPQNGLYKPQSDYILNGEGTPILRIDGFYNGRVNDFTKLKRLRCSDEELQRYLLKENDIVINRVNSIEYLGKCGLIQGMIESTVYESNMMRLHVDESKFNVRYVVQLLCSQFVYNQILSKAKKSVNQASINQKDVQSLMVYMPSIELQNKFAAFAEQVENMKSGINVSLLKLRTLKKALMQEYFG